MLLGCPAVVGSISNLVESRNARGCVVQKVCLGEAALV